MNLIELQQAVERERKRVMSGVSVAVWADDHPIDQIIEPLTHYASLAGLERAIREIEGVRDHMNLLCAPDAAWSTTEARVYVALTTSLTALYAEAEKLMEVVR